MDRLKQKAYNCINMASEQIRLAADRMGGVNKPLAPDGYHITEEQGYLEAEGLLKSALANLERARRGFSGVDLDHAFVNELAREIDAENGPTRPATWHDVVDFALRLSRPRIRRAWNLAMVVLTEEA